MNFTDLSIDDRILQGVSNAGLIQCTPVQAASFPAALQGTDLLVQSQTGSGKTAAFLIPTFQALLTRPQKALVISPTRELAIQIKEECDKLGKYTGLSFAVFYGGTGYEAQEKLLQSNPDICIGTPGRLLDFNKSRKLNFSDFSILIIDEADRLFDMGFYPDIQRIMKRSKAPAMRQTMLFSATLSLRSRQLAWSFMNQPQEVVIEQESPTVDKIQQSLYHVSSSEKIPLLLGLLKQEAPSAVLIFTNTKNQAAVVSQKLNYNGYRSLFLSGDLAQNKRLAAIRQMKEGRLQILTATDVAARGLDIEDLPLVINYDLPEDAEVYVHRIGRTARAGKSGKAISFACEKYVYHLEAIEAFIHQKIPVKYIEDDLLQPDLSVGKPIYLPKEGRLPSRSPKTRSLSSRPAPRPSRPAGGSRPPIPSAAAASAPERRRPQPASRPGGKASPASAATASRYPRGAHATEAQRLAYYQAKYGEQFTAKPAGNPGKGKRQSPTPQKAPVTRSQSPLTAPSQSKRKPTKGKPSRPHGRSASAAVSPASVSTAVPAKKGFFSRLLTRHLKK